MNVKFASACANTAAEWEYCTAVLRSLTVMSNFLSCWLMRALGTVHTAVKEVFERTTMFMVTEYWGPSRGIK